MVHILLATIIIVALIGHDKDKMITRFAFFMLCLFAALRYMYGSDYASYFQKFSAIQSGRKGVFEDEPLFTLLNVLCPSFHVLVAVTSFAFVIVMYYLITRNLPRNYVWVGLLIFIINPQLFLVNLSAMRQCLAMLLFIAAIPFARQRKPIPYVLLLLIGAMFHKSTVILIPFYLFISPKPVKAGKIIAVLAVVFAGLYLVDVVGLAKVAALWFDDTEYMHYATNEITNSLRATLLTSVYFFFVLFNLPKLKGRMLVYGKLYLIGTMLGVLAFRLSMLTRIQMYFDIFSVVVIPAILIELRKEGKVKVDPSRPIKSVWGCINHYALPILVFTIYALRYYSFFTNPMWERYFSEYRTIFELL